MRTTRDVVEEVWAARELLVRKGFSTSEIHVSLNPDAVTVNHPQGTVEIAPPSERMAWHTGFIDAWTLFCAQKG
jgi:hypothetical protein